MPQPALSRGWVGQYWVSIPDFHSHSWASSTGTVGARSAGLRKITVSQLRPTRSNNLGDSTVTNWRLCEGKPEQSGASQNRANRRFIIGEMHDLAK